MLYALAPMDWITDSPFRRIVKKIWNKYKSWSKDQLILYTEFVSSDWFVHNFDWIKDHLIYEKTEKPIICQIFWSNLQKLLYTAKKIQQNYDFDWIDLNVGCPAPKIMKTWAWGALMINKEKTLEMIKILAWHIKNFSIKTRAGLNQQDKPKQLEFIVKASEFCKMIAIHSRTLKDGHSGPIDIDFVLKAKTLANPNCKIIYNGGVNEEFLKNEENMKKMEKLDGIMIWQAAIWNPWIFVGIKPSWEEKRQVILEHLQLNIKQKWERKWVVEFRKFIWSYIKWIKNASEYRLKFMKVDNFEDFKKILYSI